MGIELLLGAVIVSPVVLSAISFRWAPREWLRAFEILGRAMGRVM